tara:strand:- start:125 stop:763 length:639 start_codon:yes stop_codon:yes gene_type:complete
MDEKKIKVENYNSLENLSFINSDSIVLDIGANIGNVTDFIFKKYNCNIFSYEPNITCYDYMKKRFANNKKIRIYNYAISNFSGVGSLYFHRFSRGTNDEKYIESATLRSDKDSIDINKNIKVKIVNIKEILNEHKNIDLIKIDIEGAEYQIMPELIKNRHLIKMVICELHGDPEGKKLDNETKNKKFMNEYFELVKKLKDNNLYNNWFYQWH